LKFTAAAEAYDRFMGRYSGPLAPLFCDFAGVEPNPARNQRVKLPSIVVEEPKPPSAEHVLAILEGVPRRWRLPLVTLEVTGMRVGEAHALAWQDVAVAECRFRLSKAATKTRRSRWVQVPEWLMAEIDASCPIDDRTPERRVFAGFTPDVAKNVMARACRAAGIPHYHPHDLRHRRLSLWHGQGVVARELADRAGHARPSMSLDVYSHVMPLDEVAWERPGVVSVWSQAEAPC
jgi:integrase